MAQFKPFNFYEAMSGGQNLAANQLKIDEATNTLRARAGLQQAISAGTPEALAGYRQRFPIEAMDYEKKLFERAKGVREQQKFNDEQRKANTEWLAGATDQVIKDPQSASFLIDEGKRRGIIDANFDGSNLDMNAIKELNRKAKVALGQLPDIGPLEKIDTPEGPQFAPRAQAVGKKPYEKPDKDEGFKSSDSNAIRAQVGELFGGTWDPMTGRIMGLSKDQATRALKITRDASNIFKQGGVTHAEAVAQAAEQAGLALPGKPELPPGLPQGSKQVGTSGGKPVYETPDGKRFIAR